MKRNRIHCVLIGSVAAVGAMHSPCSAQSFQGGDVYLLSQSYPDPIGGLPIQAIVRFEPDNGWARQVIYSTTVLLVDAAHDPFRDRILLLNGTSLLQVDAVGNTTLWNVGWGTMTITQLAPVGDGRIYLHNGGFRRFAVVDAMDVVQDIMDETGSSPFVLSGNGLSNMIYDLGTNSIIGVRIPFPHDADEFQVVKIPLSLDGLSVSAAPTILSNFASGAAGSVEPKGMSPGPGGSVFLKLDDNGGSTVARMQLIDPVTAIATTYASSGYGGAVAEMAGVYLPSISSALVLDTFNDKLRVFSAGSSGDGTIVASGVSTPGAHSELSRLLVIAAAPAPCLGDADGDGMVTFADITSVLSNWLNDYSPGTGPGDANGDGVVNFTDITTVLSNWLAMCP